MLTRLLFSFLEDAVRPGDAALNKAVINKCFSDYGDEDEIKECISTYADNREAMDPAGEGTHTLANTYSMYHQPAQKWTVVGA
mmetsp:Transcript_19923/g.31182  ORF Transcript_19923/g.31182 Transcript_19923/m.31182 type:complete len:83 (+) Transcript_19923:92-340(+)